MAELPYMQFFPSDWMADCQVLSLAGRGAWQTILCKAWHPSTQGVVSLKLAAWARLFGSSTSEAAKVIAEIEDTGVADVERDGDTITIVSRRVARDWQARVEGRKTQSDGGKLGAEKRWAKHREQQGLPNGLPNGSPIQTPIAIQKPEARSQKPATPLPSSQAQPTEPTTDGDAEDLWQNHNWGVMSQDEAIALLKQQFPGIDVWGEFQRFKKVRADAGQRPTWKPFLGWLRKATPVVEFGRKNPEKGKAARLPSEADWRAFIASEYPDAKDPGPASDAPPSLLQEFRQWKADQA